MKKISLTITALCIGLVVYNSLGAQVSINSVKSLYRQSGASLFWFNDPVESLPLRQSFVTLLDSAVNIGLNKTKYRYAFLKAHVLISKTDSASIKNIDGIFSTAAIAFCKDVYAGDITGYLAYDEVSAKNAEKDNAYIIQRLSAVKTGAMLVALIDSLQPRHDQYKTIKSNLAAALKTNALASIKRFTSEINYLRWLTHFNFEQFILVNIPSGTLDFYRNDSAILTMKVVTGKPSTKTPRFAAYCTQVVLYPYWNVPSSIGLHELLPQFKKSPALLDGMNMQVVDGSGRVINSRNINWSAYNSSNFPYQFRQATGCDNALGVIKFNITDPFNVYLHDTNNKFAFLLGARYLSHGCIRIERPTDLANNILPQKIDSSLVASCLKDQKPIILPLARPVPVLVTYLITNPDLAGPAPFYKDIYRLFK
jgi:murein L,D-transpeptidase YcbB/YkuD